MQNTTGRVVGSAPPCIPLRVGSLALQMTTRRSATLRTLTMLSQWPPFQRATPTSTSRTLPTGSSQWGVWWCIDVCLAPLFLVHRHSRVQQHQNTPAGLSDRGAAVTDRSWCAVTDGRCLVIHVCGVCLATGVCGIRCVAYAVWHACAVFALPRVCVAYAVWHACVQASLEQADGKGGSAQQLQGACGQYPLAHT